jgi:vesicle-fusing ATPase
VFGSLVGKSEENVRALFKEAEDEQRDRGDDAMLHVIILDEVTSSTQRGTCLDMGHREDGQPIAPINTPGSSC